MRDSPRSPGPSPVRPPPPAATLLSFISASFDADEFRRWVRELAPEDPNFARKLPSPPVADLKLFEDGLDLLKRNGFIAAVLFDALANRIPRKLAELTALADALDIPWTPPQSDPSPRLTSGMNDTRTQHSDPPPVPVFVDVARGGQPVVTVQRVSRTGRRALLAGLCVALIVTMIAICVDETELGETASMDGEYTCRSGATMFASCRLTVSPRNGAATLYFEQATGSSSLTDTYVGVGLFDVKSQCVDLTVTNTYSDAGRELRVASRLRICYQTNRWDGSWDGSEQPFSAVKVVAPDR